MPPETPPPSVPLVKMIPPGVIVPALLINPEKLVLLMAMQATV